MNNISSLGCPTVVTGWHNLKCPHKQRSSFRFYALTPCCCHPPPRQDPLDSAASPFRQSRRRRHLQSSFSPSARRRGLYKVAGAANLCIRIHILGIIVLDQDRGYRTWFANVPRCCVVVDVRVALKYKLHKTHTRASSCSGSSYLR